MAISIETRDSLRNSVIETLLKTFPNAQKVAGGVAFMSDTLDEETGKYFPVELKVTVKNTADTTRSTAYDLEAAVAAFAAKPGRRVADPVKAAEAAAKKEAAAAKKQANLGVLRDWCKANPFSDMTCTDIQQAIPEFAGLMPMQVGGLLKAAIEEGFITFNMDEKRKKHYATV